jgi:hypothetical protein
MGDSRTRFESRRAVPSQRWHERRGRAILRDGPDCPRLCLAPQDRGNHQNGLGSTARHKLHLILIDLSALPIRCREAFGGPTRPGRSPLDQAETTEQLIRLGAAADEPARLHRGHRCGCRQSRPCSSGGVFVFVEESAESIVSADVQMRDRGGVGDRFRQRTQGPGVRDAPMGAGRGCGAVRTRRGRAGDAPGCRSTSGRGVRGGRLGSTAP